MIATSNHSAIPAAFSMGIEALLLDEKHIAVAVVRPGGRVIFMGDNLDREDNTITAAARRGLSNSLLGRARTVTASALWLDLKRN